MKIFLRVLKYRLCAMSVPLRAEFTQSDVLQDIQDLYAIRLQLHEALEMRSIADRQRKETESELMKLVAVSREREEYIVRLTTEINSIKEEYVKKLSISEAEINRLKKVVKERDLSIKGLEFELHAARQREIISRQKLEHLTSLSAQQHSMSVSTQQAISSTKIDCESRSVATDKEGLLLEESKILEHPRNVKVTVFRRHSSVTTGRVSEDDDAGGTGITDIFKNMEVSFSSQFKGLQEQFFSSSSTTKSSQ